MKRFMFRLLGLPSALAASTAQAADALGATGSFLQMLLGLGLVLALLYGTLFLLKRLQQNQGIVAGGLKVLSATSVGPRERVVLVKAGSRILVLGVAPGRVNMLQSLEEHEIVIHEAPAAPVQDFASRLKQLLESKRREK